MSFEKENDMIVCIIISYPKNIGDLPKRFVQNANANNVVLGILQHAEYYFLCASVCY